ncbi:MAG TPA: hypothetical protein VG826_05055 [Pirellulales bacterium]|nr:hypothetical protein [Pirellulales bacterium]
MRRRLQFSVEWVLASTIVVAIALAALSAEPAWLSILAIRLTLIAAMGLVAVMAFQGGPWARAFAAGAAFPVAVGAILAVAPLFYLPEQMPSPERADQVVRAFGDLAETELRFRAGFVLGASLLSGLAGLGLSWLVLDSAEPR